MARIGKSGGKKMETTILEYQLKKKKRNIFDNVFLKALETKQKINKSN